MKKGSIGIDSLQKQLLSGIFCGMFLLIVVLELTQYYSMKNNLYEDKFQLLESRLHNIEIGVLKNTDSQQHLRENAQKLVELMVDRNVGISLVDGSGKVLMNSENSMKEVIGKRLLPNESQGYENGSLPQFSTFQYLEWIHSQGLLEKKLIVRNAQGEKYMILISKLGVLSKSSGLIQLSTSLDSADSILKKQLLWYITIAFGVFLVTAFLLGRFISYSLDPLNKITSAMAKINEHKLSTRIETDIRQIEIKRLITEFNGMLERIEDSFSNEKAVAEKMRTFVSDAAHELRTPLTSIQGFSQLLCDGDIQEEGDKKLALNSISKESQRLSRLLNHLLQLTRLDYGAHVEKKPENLKNILHDLETQLALITEHRRLDIKVEDVWVYANSDQIKQVVINLVNNASQHTDKESGEVIIEVKNLFMNETKYGGVIVYDNGSGIPKEKMERIFDRFYKVDPHRSGKYGGFGLGLSIVKSIVDGHDGKVEVESEPQKGSKFAVYFKAIDAVDRIFE